MTHDDRHIIRLRKVEPEQAAPSPTPSPMPEKKPEYPKRKKSMSRPRLLVLAGISLLLVFCLYLVIHSLFSGEKNAGDQENLTLTEKDINADVTALARVKKLMLVPDEEPAIAIVKDLIPLRDQLFFKNAQVGDFVLMFTKAAKAILYRPSEDRVIEVAPITQ